MLLKATQSTPLLLAPLPLLPLPLLCCLPVAFSPCTGPQSTSATAASSRLCRSRRPAQHK